MNFFQLSSLTKKRLRAFRRNKRAFGSLVIFIALFVFSLCADFVCPCNPTEVIDAKKLEQYRETRLEEAHDVQTARFNLLPDGKIVRYEGPDSLREKLKRMLAEQASAERGQEKLGALKVECDGYKVVKTPSVHGTRVFLEPLEPPKVLSANKKVLPIAWPFRPVAGHPFGIDAAGRDVYSRVVHGLRIALVFGLVLAFSGLLGGLIIGAIEGYFGGWTDIAGQRFTEIWSALPFLYVMIFIGSTLGRSFTVLLICYALFNWIAVSYYVRAEFLRLRTRTFVEAAKCQGFSAARIIFRHILPNALTPLITLFPFLLMGAIGSLAALDFLGFGLPPMSPSLGELLSQAQQFRSAWWLVAFPGAALFIVMLLTVLIGEGLRDAFDPRQKSRLE